MARVRFGQRDSEGAAEGARGGARRPMFGLSKRSSLPSIEAPGGRAYASRTMEHALDGQP